MTSTERALKRLWDANDALRVSATFVADRTLDDERSDALLQSAVERKLAIVGEALAAARKVDTDLTSPIPELPQVVQFRNVLIRQYAELDHELAWVIATTDAPALERGIADILASY